MAAEAVVEDGCAVTTLMLTSFPEDFGQAQARSWIDGLGSAGHYDFFIWFPAKSGKRRQPGQEPTPGSSSDGATVRQRRSYCFANFRSVRLAAQFRDACGADSGISVSVAHVQGLTNNLARYRQFVGDTSDAASAPFCFVAEDALVATAKPVEAAPLSAGVVAEGHCQRPKLEGHVYLKLFKPRGVICTHRPEQLSDRPIVSSLYPAGFSGLRPVGRLDCDSEGLLLLTSDGVFLTCATAPEVHLEKEYLALVYCGRDRQPPPPTALERLRTGVELKDGMASADVAELIGFDGFFAQLRLVVTSGRNRMVRRMLQAIGYSCQQLLRTRIGDVGGMALPLLVAAVASAQAPLPAERVPAKLGNPESLLPGEYAPLTREEIMSVYSRSPGSMRVACT